MHVCSSSPVHIFEYKCSHMSKIITLASETFQNLKDCQDALISVQTTCLLHETHIGTEAFGTWNAPFDANLKRS